MGRGGGGGGGRGEDEAVGAGDLGIEGLGEMLVREAVGGKSGDRESRGPGGRRRLRWSLVKRTFARSLVCFLLANLFA